MRLFNIFIFSIYSIVIATIVAMPMSLKSQIPSEDYAKLYGGSSNNSTDESNDNDLPLIPELKKYYLYDFHHKVFHHDTSLASGHQFSLLHRKGDRLSLGLYNSIYSDLRAIKNIDINIKNGIENLNTYFDDVASDEIIIANQPVLLAEYFRGAQYVEDNISANITLPFKDDYHIYAKILSQNSPGFYDKDQNKRSSIQLAILRNLQDNKSWYLQYCSKSLTQYLSSGITDISDNYAFSSQLDTRFSFTQQLQNKDLILGLKGQKSMKTGNPLLWHLQLKYYQEDRDLNQLSGDTIVFNSIPILVNRSIHEVSRLGVQHQLDYDLSAKDNIYMMGYVSAQRQEWSAFLGDTTIKVNKGIWWNQKIGWKRQISTSISNQLEVESSVYSRGLQWILEDQVSIIQKDINLNLKILFSQDWQSDVLYDWKNLVGQVEKQKKLSTIHLGLIAKYSPLNLVSEVNFQRFANMLSVDANYHHFYTKYTTANWSISHSTRLFNHVSISNKLSINLINKNNLLPIPTFYSEHSLAFNSKLFKEKMAIEIGIDVKILGKRNNSVFLPLLNHFTSSLSYTYDPLILLSSHINFQIDKLSFFFQWNSLEYYLYRQQAKNTMAGYITTPRYMVFGFKWLLFN